MGFDVPPYLLTWRTYGTWLPGDRRGWVSRHRNTFGESVHGQDFRLEAAARGLMRSDPRTLAQHERTTADAVIRESCGYRGWQVYALNVRTNHVHAVLLAEETPDTVAQILKARVSRALREGGSLGPEEQLWARGASRRPLFNEDELDAAIDYVLNRQ